jgi:ribosomal-protein-alanine N-acetyltransferase
MFETEGLILRPFEPDDLDAYSAIRSKPANARFLPGGEAGAADAGSLVRAAGTPWGHEAWNEGGFAPWAVVEKERLTLIGHLGLRFLPEIGETELLYLIDEPWWGRQFATEDGRAVVDFARDR